MTNKALDRTANAGLAVGSAQDTAEVVASLVMKGDISGLGPEARTRYYLATCEGLGLNPNAQPFAFLRLNGKEVMYATRGATDQLAAMHRVTRKIIDGPKVVTVEGTKMVYAVCEASLPNGRAEQSTATLPVVDPVNMLMKCETKAKRRATLSILGLAILDEMETETIPGAERIGAARVEHQQLNPVDDAPAEPAAPSALDSFRTALAVAEDLAAWGETYAALASDLGGTKASKVNDLIVKRAAEKGYHLIADEAHALCAGNLDADLAAAYDALAAVTLSPDDEDGDGVIADVVRVMRRASGLRTDLKKRVSKVGVATAEALGVERAKARITAALNPPPPPTGTDGPARESSDPAAAIGATVAANAQHGAQASAEPRVVLDPAEAEARLLRADAVGDAAWCQRLVDYAAVFAMAGAFHKRAAAFREAGVLATRRAQTLDAIEAREQRGPEAARQALDGYATRRVMPRGYGEVIRMPQRPTAKRTGTDG